MKVNIQCELFGDEIIKEYFSNKIKNEGIVINEGDTSPYKVFVHSEKTDKWVEVSQDKIKFVFNR